LATVIYLPLGGDRAQCPLAQNSKIGGCNCPEIQKKLPLNLKKINRNLGYSGMGPPKWVK